MSGRASPRAAGKKAQQQAEAESAATRLTELKELVAERYLQLDSLEPGCVNLSALIDKVPGLDKRQHGRAVGNVIDRLRAQQAQGKGASPPKRARTGGAAVQPLPDWAVEGFTPVRQLEEDIQRLQRKVGRYKKQKQRATAERDRSKSKLMAANAVNSELRTTLHVVDNTLGELQDRLDELKVWLREKDASEAEDGEARERLFDVVEISKAGEIVTMTDKGAFNVQTRLACWCHITAGTGADNVAKLIRETMRSFGLKMGQLPSQQTVLHMTVELLLMSEIQCADALRSASDLSVAHTGDAAGKHGEHLLATMAHLPGKDGIGSDPQILALGAKLLSGQTAAEEYGTTVSILRELDGTSAKLRWVCTIWPSQRIGCKICRHHAANP